MAVFWRDSQYDSSMSAFNRACLDCIDKAAANSHASALWMNPHGDQVVFVRAGYPVADQSDCLSLLHGYQI